ncbi:hypothetical protein [Halorubrum sodomense]|uniref:hypothetical protein n=1 Tax=Halorubrum sodomense TaxID=35743 RepID=UPI001160868C|nr:hypothetical protein [Halorubrum sodomense]
MRPLRALSIVLAFTAALGLIFGTAGFTAMEAQRGLAVNVTNDASAYLGYVPLTDEVHDGEPTAVVEYRNQFGTALDEFDVAVSIADPGSTEVAIESVDSPSSLDEGTAAAVNVTLRCPEREPVSLLFEADGSGGGVSVSLDRVHTVTCVPKGPTVTGIRFDDAANGRALVDGRHGEVTANVWVAETPPVEEAEDLTEVSFDGATPFDTSTKIRRQVNTVPSSTVGGNWKIVAVEFPDRNLTYLHPEWNEGAYDTPKAGGGVAYDGTVDEAFLLNASVDGGEVVEAGEED